MFLKMSRKIVTSSFSKVTLDNLDQMALPPLTYSTSGSGEYSLACVLENNTINNNVNKIFIFMALYLERHYSQQKNQGNFRLLLDC